MFNRRPGETIEKSPRVKDRQVADRALRKAQVAIDEGRVGQSRHRRKSSTVAAYTTTLEAYARPSFGTTARTLNLVKHSSGTRQRN